MSCVCCVSVYNVCVVYVPVGMYMVYVYGVWSVRGMCGMSVCICNTCVVRLYAMCVCCVYLCVCMRCVSVVRVCGTWCMWRHVCGV